MMNVKFKKKSKTLITLTGGGLLFMGALFLAVYSPVKAQPLAAVDPGLVCMVNDTVMGKLQMPVPFEDKIYYGCCEGCVGRLQNDRSVRFSKDPLSGREVDKAKAFIISGPKGEALYFESSKTAGKYMASKRS